MGQASPSMSSSACHIDTLPDDVLIVIFSFLTLYERLMVMRVSKKCHGLLSNPRVWTHVDFWQEQQLTKKQKRQVKVDRRDKPWMFPRDEHSVLDFLQKYTSGSLRSVYLRVTSRQILLHLKQNCTNLKTMSFLSATDPPEVAADIPPGDIPGDSSVHNVYGQSSWQDILPLPKHLKVCEFSALARLGQGNSDVNMVKAQCNGVLKCFGSCRSLQRLTFYRIVLSQEGCLVLSELKLTELSFLNVVIPYPRRQRNPWEVNLTSADLMPLTNLSELRSFKFSTEHPDRTAEWLNMTTFLCAAADKWHDLRCLTLVGLQALSNQTFARLTSAWTQLQVLELSGDTVTDDNIDLIAKYLKKLTSLELTSGSYSPSGLRMLCDHPAIKTLRLIEINQLAPSPEWVLAAYDVIRSLPQITFVKMVGNRVLSIHAREKIPEIARDVQIEVENAPIIMPNEWWGRDMAVALD